jgi:hypothetical protein
MQHPLQPTCLVASASNKLLVVSCRYQAIYEITVGGFNTLGTSAGIRVHAGKPNYTHGMNLDAPIMQRALGDEHNQSEELAEFRSPTCAVVDSENNLWVCDYNWLRKITYHKVMEGSRVKQTFTVSNEMPLAEAPTFMALGKQGFVFVAHNWVGVARQWESRLYDAAFLDHVREDGHVHKIRKTMFVRNVDNYDIGNVILDKTDQILCCPRDSLQCINKKNSVVKWRDLSGGGKSCYREESKDNGVEDISMVSFGPMPRTACYVTWYHGKIVTFTTNEQGPVMVMFGSNQKYEAYLATKRFAEGPPEGWGGERNVRPQTAPAGRGQAPARPSTAPAERGGGRGGVASTQQLLLRIEELCL